MNYRTAAAFRQALEARLQAQVRQSGATVSLVRLRKAVVFDRLLARLLETAPDRWTLKGGLALDFRLGRSARTTLDMDLAYHDDVDAATEALLAAQSLDLGDHFSFAIRRIDRSADLEGGAVRYQVSALLAGRLFDGVIIDLGFGDPLGWQPEALVGTDLLRFAGIAPITVPVLPLEQHVAEKLHAYTRGYGDDATAPSSRVKDLIDLVLIRMHAQLTAGRLRAALGGIFRGRGTHALPRRLPAAPAGWATGYRQLAREIGLDPAIATGYSLAAAFLDPILANAVDERARWDPGAGSWYVS